MNTSKSFIKWGLIGGLGISIYGLLMYIANVSYDSKLLYLGYFALVAVLLFGSYEFRDKENKGYATIGQLLKNGIMICLIVALISAIWSLIYMNVIDTNFVSEMLLQTEVQLEEQGLDREQIEMTLAVTKKMMSPVSFTLVSFLYTLFWGAVISVPIALVLRKEKTEEALIQQQLDEQE